MFRQGDLLFKKISELPKKLTSIPDNILVLGEATGHAHCLVGGKAYNTPEGLLFLSIAKKGQIVHEEHGAINLTVGKYAVIRQREYTNKDAIKLVVD